MYKKGLTHISVINYTSVVNVFFFLYELNRSKTSFSCSCFLIDFMNPGCITDETLPSASCFRISLVGVVIAMKLYQERVIYTVDDGTGILECSVRQFNCPEKLQISQIKQESTRSGSCDISIKADVHHILNKLENDKKMSNELYRLGDLIMVVGYVFTSNGRSHLEITIHNKVTDPNFETIWKMQQLFLRRSV